MWCGGCGSGGWKLGVVVVKVWLTILFIGSRWHMDQVMFFLPHHNFEGSAITGGYCYVSITMSTWSPSPIITTIITLIWDAYSCLPLSVPSIHSDIPPRYSQAHTTPSSISLAYLMSMLFSNHQQISPQTLYSTVGPSTCVSGYGHAWNDLLYLSHVYSMSQNFLVVYSSYTSLY